jgi:hypothetical protein
MAASTSPNRCNSLILAIAESLQFGHRRNFLIFAIAASFQRFDHYDPQIIAIPESVATS